MSPPHESSGVRDPPTKITTITIDKDGDSILVMGNAWTSTGPRFVVSSGLLSRASPKFKTIFEPFLKDSTHADLLTDARFEVSLDETYRPSLEILLSILHYHQVEKYESLTPSTLSAVARFSKKYECTRALRPWATQWISHASATTLDVNGYGHVLMACWFFNRADLIKSVSIRAIKHLPPGFFGEWVHDKTLGQMPRALKDAVATERSRISNRLLNQLQIVERCLRQELESWDMEL